MSSRCSALVIFETNELTLVLTDDGKAELNEVDSVID